jgi:HAE1 family hydrophobic/amphiphilic exporter-1
MEEEHLSPLKATKKAMHEIAGAIIATTFDGSGIYSCGFMSGPVVFYRQFSITMATAIILSNCSLDINALFVL